MSLTTSVEAAPAQAFINDLASTAAPAAPAGLLKILILEAVAADAGRIERSLRKAGMAFVAKRVATRGGFVEALETFRPDAVLADHTGPAFPGGDALAYTRRTHPEVPVVILARELAEAAAIDLLRAGARDCVLKSSLNRLAASVARAVSLEEGIRARKAAEAALRHSEVKFRTLVETTTDVIWELDDRGCLTYLSPGAKELHGYDAAELIGKPVLDLLTEPERPTVAAFLQSVIAEGEAFALLETWCRHRDGRDIAVEVSGNPVFDEGGRLTGFRGMTRDVTRRQRAEENLRASEQRFRLLVEAAPDAILLYDFDADRFISANQAAERLFACGRDEILKSGLPHFYTPAQPDGRPVPESFADNARRALGGEQVVYERRIRTAAGDERLCEVTLVRLPSAPQQRRLRASFIDVTERRRADLAVRRLERTLRLLSLGNEVVIRATDEGDLLREMCRVIVETGGYRMAWIATVEHDAGKSVTPVAWAGEVADYLVNARITWAEEPRGNGPLGRAIRSGAPQVTQDFASDPRAAPWHAAAAERGFAASAVLPLKNGEVFAALMIYAAETDVFDADALNLLQELADDLAYGIRALRDRVNGRAAEERWRASLEATVGAIASTVETRDPYTAGHQQRVARLAVAIAHALGLSDDRIHGLALAGIVHDVGKITIPAEILSKPGRLSALEYQLIQQHAQAGYEILKGVDFPWPIADMVRQHHERLDGLGYPQGLKGDQILTEAKILAVADVVEAMVSHRPYRPGCGIDAALGEIANGSGRLYDPAAVEACVALFRRDAFRFE